MPDPVAAAPAPAPVPWLHPTLIALATALGISVRTLENWRPRGAPIPPEGPCDELAVRLWVIGEAAIGKRMGKLTPIEPTAPLHAYLALGERIRSGRPDVQNADRGDLDRATKRKNMELLDTRIAKEQATMKRQAQQVFLDLIGNLDQLIERELGGTLPADIFDLCHGRSAVDATPLIKSTLREHLRAVQRRALDSKVAKRG